MDTEAFIAWALDDARSKEQRITVEVLVEQGIRHWNSQRKIFRYESLEEFSARRRERELNPAYEPFYDDDGLRKTAESLGDLKNWWPSGIRITNLDVVRFFPSLEWVGIHQFAGTDISPLTSLPALRKLLFGSLGSDFGCCPCEDFTPLARCSSLREITLGFAANWPDFTGFEEMHELGLFEISGNLDALPRGLTLPRVRRAKLYSRPMDARSVAFLPELPACEFLTLSGVERLNGIEKMPHLRNLTLLGSCRSFEPLAALQKLTCLTIQPAKLGDAEKLPRDISPIATLPELRVFQIGPLYNVYPDMPRDYLPMAEAPALREIVVKNCPPVQMEVAAILAGLPPWDEVFLAEEPRPLPDLQIVVAPYTKHPGRREDQLDPDDHGLIDAGLRECEGRWIGAYAQRFIAERLDHADWGKATANGAFRSLHLSIESYDIVERLPEIVYATREILARLRADYIAAFGIHLRIKPPVLTAAQQAVEDKLQQQRDDWEFEEKARERAEYCERLHEFELRKQQGLEIDPADFSPSAAPSDYPQRAPIAPDGSELRDDEGDEEIDFANSDYDEDDAGEGEIAVATDPDRPHNPWEEHDHPLADNYLCAGAITLDEMWIYAHLSGIGCHLMQREPDRVIPDDKKEGE